MVPWFKDGGVQFGVVVVARAVMGVAGVLTFRCGVGGVCAGRLLALVAWFERAGTWGGVWVCSRLGGVLVSGFAGSLGGVDSVVGSV